MQSKYGGYMGRVLQINLSTGDVTDYPWTDKDRELYIGGKTMAAKILYDTLTGRDNLHRAAHRYRCAQLQPLQYLIPFSADGVYKLVNLRRHLRLPS